MFIPEHLIIEEENRKHREQDRRLPLYAPRPQRMPERGPNDRRDAPIEPGSDRSGVRRGVLIIDLEDYTEIDL